MLGAFALALSGLKLEIKSAVTISFLTLAFSQLWHVFNMRSRDSAVLRNEITQNIYVWIALILCVGLIAAAVKSRSVLLNSLKIFRKTELKKHAYNPDIYHKNLIKPYDMSLESCSRM